METESQLFEADGTGPVILKYDNYHHFLRDCYLWRKRQNRKFSLRFFARQAGFQSHSFFDKIMRGERNLTLESALKISRVLGLKKDASRFFQTLVLYNQARTFEEKQCLFKELQDLRRSTPFYKIREDEYDYYGEWYYQVIRELAVYGDWYGDYQRLARMVRPAITPLQARQAVETLLRIGLLKKTAGGRFIQASPVVTGEKVPVHIIKNARTQYMLKAIEASETIPREERHISYATLAVSRKTFDEISGQLDELRRKILAAAVDDKNVENVYSLQLHLFPLGQNIREPGKK